MSKWHKVNDKYDVSLNEKGDTVQVCFDGDHEGNIWVEIPIEYIDRAIRMWKPKTTIQNKFKN